VGTLLVQSENKIKKLGSFTLNFLAVDSNIRAPPNLPPTASTASARKRAPLLCPPAGACCCSKKEEATTFSFAAKDPLQVARSRRRNNAAFENNISLVFVQGGVGSFVVLSLYVRIIKSAWVARRIHIHIHMKTYLP
jgi:hypothetical protein